MSVSIRVGDVIAVLREMPDESVDCVVTSPPYWGLRDYGVAGQLGLEPTLGEHIEKMVGVFAEVRRVMKPEATLWLNYGDCYATTPNGKSAADYKASGSDDRTFRDKPFSTIGPIHAPDAGNPYPRGIGRRGGGNNAAGPIYDSAYRERTTGGIHADRRPDAGGRVIDGGTLKPKDLCMVPNRIAIALQDDGWWVRSEIIWHKPNPMPESVTDRPATSHEKIFLLTKSAKYYYDAEAVRVPAAASSIGRWAQDIEGQTGSGRANAGGKTNGTMKAVGGPRKTDKQRGHGRRHDGFNDRWDDMTKEEQISNGANLRNVWTIPTMSFSEAHFATFPPSLIEPCIKAGCPDGGTVLDPFGGAGTTGLVADRLDRNAVLIELNPEYAEIARRRIRNDGPLFAEVTQ